MQTKYSTTPTHSTTPLDKLEHSAADLVARLAPWLAPLPTAFLVGRATIDNLNWPVWVAIVAAAVIESLGLASTSTALALWDWNRSKRKTDPSAPVGLAFGLVGVYFLVATGLTVLLDVIPQAAAVAPAIFPALSLTGVTILALRADHARRLSGVTEAKTEAKAARQAARARKQAAPQPASPAPQPATMPQDTGTNCTRDRALAILAAQPGISGSALGRQVDRSPRLGRKLKAELLPELEAACFRQPGGGNGRVL